LKMFGIPAPKYHGFPLYQNWKELPIKDKARSILGTVRRIIQRKYYKPLDYKNKALKRV
jgi:coenzyme F420 hydrogenase subunit beta